MSSNGRPAKKSKPNSALEELKRVTVIVADTGDVEAIRKLMPQVPNVSFCLGLRRFPRLKRPSES
eukprot:scaffold109_cov252-Pinguiococcus_pyrenoidosus.AAC.32